MLTKQLKQDLFNLIKKEPDPFGDPNDNIGFIREIWDLESMESTDPRCKNALEDFVKHTIQNYDWDIDYQFIDRLKLLEDDELFRKFLHSILSPKFRKNEDEILKFVLIINPFLEKDELKLAITDRAENGLPIYTIQVAPLVQNLPLDIKINSIPFFVTKTPSGRSDRVSSHSKPNVFPSFALVFNSGWNDYSIHTTFNLFYYNASQERTSIGITKIMKDGSENVIDDISQDFNTLDDTFCSVGQTIEYYVALKDKLGNAEFDSVMYALRDAAIFPQIQEKFEKNKTYRTSLIRDDSSERIVREVKYKLYGYNAVNLYKFKYIFKPPFSEDPINVDFDFDSELILPNRIYAIIGKNGTGKTQLITSLPIKISQNKDNFFVPKTPKFSKVIAVSYSIFDKFEVPKTTAAFNYVYCGLRNDRDEEINERGLVLRFHNTWKKIQEIGRINKWRKILLNFIEEEIVDSFLLDNPAPSEANSFIVSIEGFNKIKNQLSSGQSIILYVISEITAHIRFDSLLLYDEPETHLHPNAITRLINTIYELVYEFQSYCVITTHSPLIVREILSKNVYVIDRQENVPSIRRIGIESFGENLSTITDEVFGNREIPKQYKKTIENLVNLGKSYDEITALLQFDEVPISLSTSLFINSFFKDEKS